MSVEQELPHLLAELANDHVVGEPPAFESGHAEGSERGRARQARFTIAAAAACSAVLLGGLVAIRSLNDDEAPAASSSTTSETSEAPSSVPSTSTPPIAARQPLDLIRIEAESSAEGTTGAVLVFDGDLPTSDPVPVENVATAPSDRVGYATQTSDGSPVSVCGATHWFPAPGNRLVDVLVPSDWFDQAVAIDPPISWDPGSASPSKIVRCEPLNGIVQISIWGSASGRMEDLRVSVDERTIVVEIAPDPTVAPPFESTVLYGSRAQGFVVIGNPVGLRLTVVPTQETAGGLLGESRVSQRFTAATHDSQVNIGRTSNIDPQVVLEPLEAAALDPASGASAVVVGDEKFPGYLFRETGLGWRGLTWFLPDGTHLWVLASGLTDDEIFEIAQHVKMPE